MSDTLESPPLSSTVKLQAESVQPETQHQTGPDLLKDIVLWRRKQLNVLLLAGATAAWTLMQIYQYNFITLCCWLAIAFVVCCFFWGNIHRLLKKEAPDLSELEISERTATETAHLFRQRVEEVIRMMFHVSCEREWFVFAGIVGFLYLLSMVARHFDLLTLCYMGVVGGMTMPVAYLKNREKLGELGGKLRIKSRRVYSLIEEKLQHMKNRVAGKHKEIKEKKME